MTYVMTLPKDRKTQPTRRVPGRHVELPAAADVLFGLTLCDTESAPEFTKTCKPGSDGITWSAAIRTRQTISQHPGNALHGAPVLRAGLRAPVRGIRLHRHSVLRGDDHRQPGLNQNTGIANTKACNNFILGGEEPINWAYITRNGVSQAPANPLFTGTFTSPNFSAVNPDVTRTCS